MVFIGYNHKSEPISIVVARSKELAYAFWQGKGILPHSHKSVEEDFTPLSEHPTGVFPLLTTEVKSVYEISGYKKDARLLLVTKN